MERKYKNVTVSGNVTHQNLNDACAHAKNVAGYVRTEETIDGRVIGRFDARNVNPSVTMSITTEKKK